MMRSKIPVPGKKPAVSSIPVPKKCLGTLSKDLPLNSKNAAVSKKPAPIKQVQSISSKVREEKENVAERLPSSKSYDSKKVKSSFNSKKVTDSKSTLIKNNLIKQTKPVPVRPPKIIVTKTKPVPKRENQQKRFSSYKPQNARTTLGSINEIKAKSKTTIQSSKVVNPVKNSSQISRNTLKENNNRKFSSYKPQNARTTLGSINEMKAKSKTTIQSSKVVNPVKNSSQISKNTLKENNNRNVPVIKKEEKFAVVTPIKQINLSSKFGVDDSEFQKSSFFKSLILHDRELTPRIIKNCSEVKFSPSKADFLQQPPKAPPLFLTADEFVEELKRTSAKYHRVNGRLVLRSPQELKHKLKSADEIVEEVKRLSGRCLQRNNNSNHSPSLANRRWTCNVLGKPSIASMSITEIAAELRRISEIRRESGAQIYKKAPFLEFQNSVQKLNPHQRALHELNLLTAKKRDRMKKKVTFFIPSPGSPNLTTSSSAKPETKLSDISEGSSNNCTPELDFGNGRVTATSKFGDSADNVEETSVITTPELNFTARKFEFGTSKNCNETLPFDLSHKNNTPTDNKSTTNQAVLLEKDVSTKNSDQCSQNSSNLTNVKSDFISSKFSSLKICENNVYTAQSIPDSNPTSSENYSTNTNMYSEFFNVKSTDCLFQSVQNLPVPTNYQPVNETEKFSVKGEKTICTPHPIHLHKSNLQPNAVSPSFFSKKFTTLNSLAPICTPFVLKTLSHSPVENLNNVRQRLDFRESNYAQNRRESQINLQSIPTIQKMNDFLCDQECTILSSQVLEGEVRYLINPIAFTLNNGDEMHFIPISSP